MLQQKNRPRGRGRSASRSGSRPSSRSGSPARGRARQSEVPEPPNPLESNRLISALQGWECVGCGWMNYREDETCMRCNRSDTRYDHIFDDEPGPNLSVSRRIAAAIRPRDAQVCSRCSVYVIGRNAHLPNAPSKKKKNTAATSSGYFKFPRKRC